MKVKVTKENVIVTEYDNINQGEVGVHTCSFEFPECFDGLSVTASFNNIPIPIFDNKCSIPTLKKGTVVLGVYAYTRNDGAVTLMYSPKPTVFYVDAGSYTGETAVEETPEIGDFEQYCRNFASEILESIENEVQKEAENKQDILVSGENIKTINGESLLGSGDITLEGGSADAELRGDVTAAIGETTRYKDITADYPLKVGAYNASTGKYNAAQTTGQCTEIFPVTQGEKYKVTGYATYYYCILALYDENQTFIKSFSAYEIGTTGGTVEYTIPETETDTNGNEKTVAYISCGTHSTTNKALIIEKEVTELNNVQKELENVREEFGKEAENASQSSKVAIDIAQKSESIKDYTAEYGTFSEETGAHVSSKVRVRTGFIPVYGSFVRLKIPEGIRACIWEFDENKSFVKYDDWREGTYEYAVSNPYIRLTFKNDATDDTITIEQVQETVVAEYSPLLSSADTETDTDTDEEIVLSEAEIKACQDFSSLFVSTTGRAETLLFFADPHLAHETDVYPKFDFMLDKIKVVYDSTPVSTCVCGGDWLLDGNTKESASWLLGKIDGAMKTRFGKYINVLGNHDTNYLGDAYKENLNQADHVKCILSNTTLANLWYRKYGKNYFAVNGDCTKFYVFDTGIDWDATMNDYRWEQVDWFANSLIEENPERCAILLHIGTNRYVATPMVDNLTKVAQAFNNKTTLTLNNITYDFTDSTGHVYFALAGHAHVDMALVQNDIPVVLTAQTCKYTDTTPTYDLVLADYGANKIRLVRVGEERSHEGTDDFDDNSIRTFDMA